MLDLLIVQLTDPFRIALLVALVYVWTRNRGANGGYLPLVAGWVFVAVLLPLTTQAKAGPMLPSVLTGLASNAAILAVVLAVWTLWQRRKG